jgi:hypothetical protein
MKPEMSAETRAIIVRQLALALVSAWRQQQPTPSTTVPAGTGTT